MRLGGLGAEGIEIVGWSEIAEGLVGSLVVSVSEGPRLGALDATVEAMPLRRQVDEFEAFVAGHRSSKTDMNSDPPSTWIALTLKGGLTMSLSEPRTGSQRSQTTTADPARTPARLPSQN
jgi:hypothetical protein